MISSCMKKATSFTTLIGSMLLVLGLLSPSIAIADQAPFTWSIGSVVSSTYEVGANPELTIALEAEYNEEELDLESMTLKWPNGLIPVAGDSEYCDLAQTSESVYYCANPSAEPVGSQLMEFTVLGYSGTFTSTTYQETPQHGEAARMVSIPEHLSIPYLGIEIPGDELPDVVSISKVLLRSNGSGIDMVVDEVPDAFSFEGFSIDIHIYRLESTVDGTKTGASGTPLLTIPAICDSVSFDATFVSYGVDEQVATDTEPFPVANCESVPYNPAVGLSLTSFIAGSTSNLVTSTESNPADAPTKEMRIALPAGFGMAPSGVTACGAAEVAAASCQSTSQLGTITISSALSPTPIEGTIHMGEPQGDAIGIAVFLNTGFGDIQLSGAMRQTQEGGVEMAFDYFPPLPGSGEVDISLSSSSGGSLLNPFVCGTYYATSTQVSHNSRQVVGTHPLNIVGCQAQDVETDLMVKLWKPINNRYTDMRLKVSQHPRKRVDKATFYLPNDLKFKYKRYKKKDPLAYVEFWDNRKEKRARLFPYKTKKKKKKASSKKRSVKKSSKSKRKPKKSTSSIKLKANNKQLKDLRVTLSKTKSYTKVTLRNIPNDKELADFSIRLFGKRTKMVRTFKKCVRHRNLVFKVKIQGASGDKGEASYKQRVKCKRERASKKRGNSGKKRVN